MIKRSTDVNTGRHALACSIAPRHGANLSIQNIVVPFAAPAGVSRKGNRFQVLLYLPGCERRELGSFRDELEAALAYDAAVREHGLPTRKLNFPNGPPARPDETSGGNRDGKCR
jgi:hypothetical protein